MSDRTAKTARLLHWILILAAIGLLIVLIRSREEGADVADVRSPPLRRGEGARVIQIHRRGGPVDLDLERRDGRWFLLAPLADVADPRTVRELLRALEEIETHRTITADNLVEYGLDPPAAQITLRTNLGRAIEVRVGDQAPASGGVYATWSGLDAVSLIAPPAVEAFFRSDLLTWRERTVLPHAGSGIDSVQIFWPGEQARLQRFGHKEWAFLAPSDREADGDACARTVAAFWRFPFSDFFDDPATWPSLGFESPRATWIVFRGDQCDTLLIGNRISAGEIAVKLQGRVPGLIRDDLYDNLVGGIRMLELRTLVSGEPGRQRILALTGSAGQGRCYRRRDGDWSMRPLAAAEAQQADKGVAPDTTVGEWQPAAAGLGSEIEYLFTLRGGQWRPPLEAPPRPGAYDLRLHLWDAEGTYQWAFFTRLRAGPAGTDELPADRPRGYSGLGVGARQPLRPIEVDAPRLESWERRLLRPLDAAPRPQP